MYRYITIDTGFVMNNILDDAGTSISGPPGALISMTLWVAGILASTAVLSLVRAL